MRFVLTAAAIAISGLVVSSANAEPTFVQGGPVKQGNMCQVSTSGGDAYFGYMTPCAPEAKPAKAKKKMKS